MESLVDLVYTPLADWQEQARQAFADALPARYQRVTSGDALGAQLGRTPVSTARQCL